MNIALLIAGGNGVRMNQDIPKQFLNINDKPVIIYTLEAFQKHPEIDEIAVVCLEGWQEILWAYARQFNISKLKWVVDGGLCGQESIRNGVYELEKHYEDDDIVLIHWKNGLNQAPEMLDVTVGDGKISFYTSSRNLNGCD